MIDSVSSKMLTHIREELRPSPPLQEVLGGFLNHPTADIRLYTEAERIVPTETFRGATYQEYVRTADERLKKLGHRTLAIAREVKVQADPASLTLLFDINKDDRLPFAEMTAALDEIEWEGTAPSGLYLRFARSTLAHEIQCRKAAGDLLYHLRQPGAEREMWVGSPRIVSRDITVRSIEED